MSDPGMAKVVDGGVFDAGKFEIAINGGANVADEEGTAVFGDEEMLGFFGGLADGEPTVDGSGSGFVERNHATRLGFVGLDH